MGLVSDTALPTPRESTWPMAGLFLLSLFPAMVAFLPGFFRAWWNLTDPEQRSLISPTSVMVMKILLAAVFIQFMVAVVSLVVARLREQIGRASCRERVCHYV